MKFVRGPHAGSNLQIFRLFFFFFLQQKKHTSALVLDSMKFRNMLVNVCVLQLFAIVNYYRRTLFVQFVKRRRSFHIDETVNSMWIYCRKKKKIIIVLRPESYDFFFSKVSNSKCRLDRIDYHCTYFFF